MTYTETRFRNWAKKEYPKAYIKKLPDFKQIGSACAIGLPDYLLIHNFKTIWFEVKSGFGDTLNLMSHFTQAQKVEFVKMHAQGANINIACFTKNYGFQVIDFTELLQKPHKIAFKNRNI